MKIMGIDPGVTGGIAVIATDFEGRAKATMCCDTPTVAGKTRTEYDIPGILKLIKIEAPDVIGLEQQHPMPVEIFKFGKLVRKQGSVSIFSTGYGYGLLRGLIAGMGIKHVIVPPQTWQTSQFKGLRKAGTKKLAYMVASGLYPEANLKGPMGGIKDGRCDALLIAEYTRTMQE